MSAEKENQQQDSGKVAKTFDENIKTLTALLKGNKIIHGKAKVPKDDVSDLVDELIEEEVAEKAKSLKADLKGLITSKVGYDKAVAEEEKKFAKFKEDKQKEFNQKAQQIFQGIEGVNDLKAAYYATMGQVGTAVSTEVEKGNASPQ